jgi:hypothetical protein
MANVCTLCGRDDAIEEMAWCARCERRPHEHITDLERECALPRS